jgi:hypothetical protein
MIRLRHAGQALTVAGALAAAPAFAQQTVQLGSVGSSSANGWPS